MHKLFEHTSASWVRYSGYEWRTAADGNLYLLPTPGAEPQPYDPMADAETLVCEAMDTGLLCFQRASDTEIRNAIARFACKYGLLGIMTALPTTARFMEYEKVYLPKNQLIRAESMDTADYLDLFFPFRKPDFRKNGVESSWSEEDPAMISLIMTYQEYPQSTVMGFMRDYGERYDWLKAVFKDWSFTFMTSFLYYNDREQLDEDSLLLYQKGIAAFDGNAPTYHIELRETPTLVWDFHSLMLVVKMLFSMLLTDEQHPLRMCRNCQKAFIAKERDDLFCSPECERKGKME
ncbi:MAG: hypothetical protein IJL08_07380 [Oscillospiraceae bacterium]|nr:hypothetical protein [Oscillospiraceae bacterium]